MSEYAFAPDPEAGFDAGRDGLEQMICVAREHGTSGGWSADAAERAVAAAGCAVELQVLQGFHDTRAAEQQARAEGRKDGHHRRPYDVETAPRRPHDIITLAKVGEKKHKKKTNKNRKERPSPKTVRKWLTASVADDPADVIKCVFDHAEASDPEHRRCWVVLVDGAIAQIDAIRAEAAKRNAPIHILIDVIHVLQYLHAAARVLHPGGEAADTAVAEWALTILNGRSADVADYLATAAEVQHDPDDRKKIGETVTCLRNKHDYLSYDTALAAGWPIATGIVKGAARHLTPSDPSPGPAGPSPASKPYSSSGP